MTLIFKKKGGALFYACQCFRSQGPEVTDGWDHVRAGNQTHPLCKSNKYFPLHHLSSPYEKNIKEISNRNIKRHIPNQFLKLSRSSKHKHYRKMPPPKET